MISRRVLSVFSALSVLFAILLPGCSSSPTDGGDPNPPVDINIASALISVHPESEVAGILINVSGAVLFYAESAATWPKITRLVIVDASGESTSITRNSKGEGKPATRTTGGQSYEDIFAAIHEAMDSVNRAIQDDLLPSVAAPARGIADEMANMLAEYLNNPASIRDRLHRFVMDEAIVCADDIVACVNAFLEAIGNEVDQIDDGGGSPPSPPLITPDEIDTVDDEGSRVALSEFTGFSVATEPFVAPADLSISLDPAAPLNSNGIGLRHRWSYEGGPSEVPPTVMGSGLFASLLLAEPGSYTITLDVKYSDGGSLATASKLVEILPSEVEGPSFTATTSSSEFPKVYTLIATDPSGTATNFDWGSSDGQVATGQSTTISFASAGSYTITLTVTYGDTSTAEATQTVIVSDEPQTLVQEVFANLAGSYANLSCGITLDGQFQNSEATYEGFSNREEYTAIVEAGSRSVNLSTGRNVSFPENEQDYSVIQVYENAGQTSYQASYLDESGFTYNINKTLRADGSIWFQMEIHDSTNTNIVYLGGSP